MDKRDIVFIALFAAIVASLTAFPPITFPLAGVPITAQSLGVMLAGGVLGAVRGSLAITLFLGLVAIGLPLLPGGRGGFGVFLGPTGGFLVGWIIAAANAIRSVLEAVGRFCRPDKSSSLTVFVQHLAAEDGIIVKRVLIKSFCHGTYYDEMPSPDDLKLACAETVQVVKKYAAGQLEVIKGIAAQS